MNGLAETYAEDEGVRFVYMPGYAFIAFGCGRAYEGLDHLVEAAAERHRQSGCKRCRRYERRMAAVERKRAEAEE